jgi:hypothetical protein
MGNNITYASGCHYSQVTRNQFYNLYRDPRCEQDAALEQSHTTSLVLSP